MQNQVASDFKIWSVGRPLAKGENGTPLPPLQCAAAQVLLLLCRLDQMRNLNCVQAKADCPRQPCRAEPPATEHY